MALSMYDVSVPVFIRALTNLSAILEKGAAHAKAQGMDAAELIQTRLIADMDPLPAQIQRASDAARAARHGWRGLRLHRFRIPRRLSRSFRSASPRPLAI
jgi:hypothetical protein